MKNKNLLLIIACLALFISGCKQPAVQDKSTYAFSFAEYDQILPMESIFESVEAITLDSKDVPLIGEVGKSILQNDLLYIQDKLNHTILTFDMKGNFIRILDKKGKGPGEYFEINDFEINEFDNTIDVMFKTGVVYQYTLDGQFVDRYILPGEIKAVHNFANLTADIVVFYNSTTDYRLYYYSRSKSTIIRKEFNQPPTSMGASGLPFTRSDNKITFYEGFSDQRYSIDTNGIHDNYKIDLGEYSLDYKDITSFGAEKLMYESMRASLTKAFSWANAENKEYIVTIIRIKDSNYTLLINKKNGSQTGLKAFTNGSLFPYGAQFHGNELIMVMPAHMLKRFILPDKKGGLQMPAVDHISELDNPVVLKYKLKEHF